MSLYDASVPVFVQILNSLTNCLDKAASYCEVKKIDPAVLAQARLYPDMFPLAKQIQIATDNAKGAPSRLAGVDIPSYPDSETTLADLKARLQKTLDYVKTFKPEQFAGAETRDIAMKLGDRQVSWKGTVYLFHFALPNFFFHASTAYAILRHNGVDIGKRDFIGSF